MRVLVLVGMAALAACAGKVTLPNGAKVSEGAFVHLQVVDAVKEANKANSHCFEAVGTIPAPETNDPLVVAVSGMSKALGIANCNAGQGQAQMQVPAYVPQPSIGSQLIAGTVELAKGLAPVAGAAIQAKYNADIALGAQSAQTAQNGQQWTALGGIVRDTSSASAATATGAANAMATFGAASLGANSAATAAAFDVLRAGFSVLPQLTPSIVAGANVIQGNANDLSTRRDTLTAGNDLRVGSPGPIAVDIDMSQYTLVCTAAPASSTTGAPSTAQTCTLVPRSP